MISNVRNDLLGHTEDHHSAKEMWDILRYVFVGTFLQDFALITDAS